MADRKYIIYEHISPKGKRYIGITSQKTRLRWRNGKGYVKNTHFYRAIEKFGWDNFIHHIIKENVDEEDAKEMEKSLIKKYKTTNPKYGYNVTRGGDTRAACSEEVKEKIRCKNIGKKRTNETKQKMSEAAKKRPRRQLTEEHKRKISLSLIGNKRAVGCMSSSKKIAMCDDDCNIIEIFKNAVFASKRNGNVSSSGINAAARENMANINLENTKYGGKYAGYKWFYVDDSNHIIKNAYGEKRNKRNNPIRQCNANGEKIRDFKTIAEASASLGDYGKDLAKALIGNTSVLFLGNLWVRL